MKRTLLLITCALMISSAAMADHIGIYRDETGGSCYLGVPGQFNSTATIIHLNFTAGGATGSRFKAVFPAGTTFLGFSTPYISVGTLDVDLSLGYGQCLSGTSIVLGNILAIYGEGLVAIQPAVGFASIIYTNCLFAELPASGGNALVSPVHSEPCYVAVEPSTWGSVKSLYR